MPENVWIQLAALCTLLVFVLYRTNSLSIWHLYAINATLPALIIPTHGNNMLGIVTSCSGIAMILGSLIVTLMPKPKD